MFVENRHSICLIDKVMYTGVEITPRIMVNLRCAKTLSLKDHMLVQVAKALSIEHLLQLSFKCIPTIGVVTDDRQNN